MDTTYFKSPWHHSVIDNFFSEDILDHVNKIASTRITKYEVISIEDKLLSEYFQKTLKSKSKRHILELNLMQPKTDYPIHDEATWKKLSVVVYIKPDISNGTYLFDKNQKIAKQVDWKVNRAFIFKGVQGLTWHSYANTYNTPRLTMNYFEL